MRTAIAVFFAASAASAAVPAGARFAAMPAVSDFLRPGAAPTAPRIEGTALTSAAEAEPWYREQAEAAWNRTDGPAPTPAALEGDWRMVAEIGAGERQGRHSADGIEGGSLRFSIYPDPFDHGGTVLRARFARGGLGLPHSVAIDSTQTAHSTATAAGIQQVTFWYEGRPSATTRFNKVRWDMACRLAGADRLLCAFRYNLGWAHNPGYDPDYDQEGESLVGFVRVRG